MPDQPSADCRRSLPYQRRSVSGEGRVLAGQRQAFGKRLRNQDAVERIFMQIG